MAPSRYQNHPGGLLLLVGLAFGGLFLLATIFSLQSSFVLPLPRYLAVHVLIELASILVSFAIFIVNWEATKQSRNAQSLFVAAGFLPVAAFSTMHIFSFQGMPDFVTPNTLDKATYFWVASNLWPAGVLWIAAHVHPDARGRLLDRSILAAANLLTCGVVFVGVVFFESMLPALYVEGQGDTPLKLALEYAAVPLSLGALLAYVRLYASQRDESLVLLMAALVAYVFAMVAFCIFLTSFGVYDLLGHGYRVIAFYLVFRALLVSSVQRPHIQLIVAKDRLERTVAELDARNRELDALVDIVEAISGTLKPDQLLELAIEKVMKVMRASGGAIFLLSEGTDQLRLSAWRGLPMGLLEALRGRRMRLPKGLALSGESCGSQADAQDLEPVRRLGLSLARTAPMGVCTCAPIASKGRLLGMIAMVGKEGGAFAVRDRDLLTAVGYQLGLAIENAQLYEQTDERLREKVGELQRAERRSRLLSEVGALLGGGAELRRLLDLVARRTAEVVGDWCSIYLLDEREKLLRLEAAYHPDEEELKAIRSVLSKRAVRLNEGLVGVVAATGEATLASRVTRDEIAAEVQQQAQSVEEIAILRMITPTSRMAAPMRAMGRTVGVLLVMNTHTRQPFSRSDLSLVKELADRVGGAVESNRLFQESQAQRRHLEAIISQMVDGVVVTDESGEVSVINESARRMLGQSTNLLFDTQKQAVGDTKDRRGRGNASGTSLIGRALGGATVIGESITVAAGGGERVLSASASPLRREEGDIAGAVVVLRDVTAEREVERMKDEFVAVVSHELRTPITAVLGYTDILLRGLRGPLAPSQVKALGSVRTAAHRLLALINDLLDMSRLEAGKQELLLAQIDLQAAVDRALSAVSVLASAKRICLAQEVPSGLPPVLADEEQLQRILGNLLSNAIKFTPEGGRVSVAARLSEGVQASQRRMVGSGEAGPGTMEVTVTDTGVGIPPEQQERIWDKFHQVDSSSRRPFGGTGLGLAIAKGLVELHGGKVWVESQGIAGRGSTFGFTLPLVPGNDRG
ncbi:MAG: MASE3 domain-containing protein [Sphingomonadaceae bacterium]